MVTLITILHVLICLFLILVVLLQAGKGGGMGLAFGSSGAQTVFGGSGAGNFLTKVTAGTAIAFMLTSLTLAYFASARESSWLDDYEKQAAAQLRRERDQREKLGTVPTAGDGGAAAVAGDGGAAATPAPAETEENIDKGDQPAAPTAPAPSGTAPAPAPSGTAPAPAPAPTPPTPTPAPAR